MKYRYDDFTREDERDDTEFYRNERFVSHLDSLALETVEKIIGSLIRTENAVILDLMASWDSHIPSSVEPAEVIGLGLNEIELAQNASLSHYIIHDINKNPQLPFADNTIDAVICTVSVDYMTQPVEVFKEIGRILKPGGLNLIIFSNRMFPPKAVKIWKEASEPERLLIVEDFFKQSEAFGKIHTFISRGKPRPKDDKYSHMGIPSDPIYAVYARKPGGAQNLPDAIDIGYVEASINKDELERKKAEVKDTLCCPYCDTPLKKLEVPQGNLAEWPNEYFYVCLNDECSYFIRGWDAMAAQGNHCSYRLMYDPLTDSCQPALVHTRNELRNCVVE